MDDLITAARTSNVDPATIAKMEAWVRDNPRKAAQYAYAVTHTSYAVDRSLDRPLVWRRKQSWHQRIRRWLMHPETRRLMADVGWCIVTFVVVTIVAYGLHGQGVPLPTLPDWLTGL